MEPPTDPTVEVKADSEQVAVTCPEEPDKEASLHYFDSDQIQIAPPPPAQLRMQSVSMDVCRHQANDVPMLVEGEWLYLKETILKVKEDIEEDCEEKFPMFDAIFFIQRDNYIIIKVHVGEEKYADVTLMSNQLYSYKLGRKRSDSLQLD